MRWGYAFRIVNNTHSRNRPTSSIFYKNIDFIAAFLYLHIDKIIWYLNTLLLTCLIFASLILSYITKYFALRYFIVAVLTLNRMVTNPSAYFI